MTAIDIHTHAFPDALAPRAMEKLQAMICWPAAGDGSIDGLIASMDAADVDVSVICTIATKPDQAKGILKWCKSIRCERIEPLASVHPKDRKPGRILKKIRDAGLVGIKLHPLFQHFDADDPIMDEIYAAASDFGLLIEMHCGLDVAFPPENLQAEPMKIARVIEKFPDLKLIWAHMGGWRMWDDVEKYLLGANVYLETSVSLTELSPARSAGIITRHGHERVLFGSDYPWAPQDKTIELIENLPLTDRQKSGILWRNAARLLGYDKIFT